MGEKISMSMIETIQLLVKKYWLGVVICIITLFILDYVFHTVCFSTLIFGIPCPACGITRATKLLLTGQIKESFYMHPLLIIFIITSAFCLIIKKVLKKCRFFLKLYGIIWLVIFIAFYIYRMANFYPRVEPLTYYKDNFIAILYHLWTSKR